MCQSWHNRAHGAGLVVGGANGPVSTARGVHSTARLGGKGRREPRESGQEMCREASELLREMCLSLVHALLASGNSCHANFLLNLFLTLN